MSFLRKDEIDQRNSSAALLRFITHFSYKLYSKARSIEGPYEPITPTATYAPWLADSDFLKIYKVIKEYTLVNILMCYGLWSLIEQSSKLSGALMEVGVWRGGTGGLIGKAAEKFGITDTVYLCDNFEGIVKAGNEDWFFKGGELKDTSEKIVSDLINNRLQLKQVKILKGIFPDATAKLVDDTKFRFCHIDVVVYDSAKDIFEWIWDKMVIGGILVFDDYGFRHCSGITKFVNELKTNPDIFYNYNLSGHGILIKK